MFVFTIFRFSRCHRNSFLQFSKSSNITVLPLNLIIPFCLISYDQLLTQILKRLIKSFIAHLSDILIPHNFLFWKLLAGNLINKIDGKVFRNIRCVLDSKYRSYVLTCTVILCKPNHLLKNNLQLCFFCFSSNLDGAAMC